MSRKSDSSLPAKQFQSMNESIKFWYRIFQDQRPSQSLLIIIKVNKLNIWFVWDSEDTKRIRQNSTWFNYLLALIKPGLFNLGYLVAFYFIFEMLFIYAVYANTVFSNFSSHQFNYIFLFCVTPWRSHTNLVWLFNDHNLLR